MMAAKVLSDAPVVTLVPEGSLDAAIRAIHVEFAKALDADGKAIRHRLAAGRMLVALQQKIDRAEDDETRAAKAMGWWSRYRSKFVRSKRDAQRVMAMARAEDREAAAEEEVKQTRERMRQYRGGGARASPSRGGDFEEVVNFAVRAVERVLDRVLVPMTCNQRRQLAAQLKEMYPWLRQDERRSRRSRSRWTRRRRTRLTARSATRTGACTRCRSPARCTRCSRTRTTIIA